MNTSTHPFPVELSATPASNFRMIHASECADPTFHFQVLLSDAWLLDRKAEIQSRKQGLHTRFVHDSCAAITLHVAGVYLQREVGPADWLQLLVERNGETVLNRHDTYSMSGGLAEMLTATSDGKFVLRSTVRKDGNRLLVLRASSPERFYSSFADEFLMATRSLEFQRQKQMATAERLRAVPVQTPFGCVFSVPESWSSQQVIQQSEASVFCFENRHEARAYGRMEFRLSTKDADLQAHLSHYLERLRTYADKIGRTAIFSPPGTRGFDSALAATFPVQIQGSDSEATLIVQQGEGDPKKTAEISLLSPSRDRSPEWWMVNKRALEIARDSFVLEDQLREAQQTTISETAGSDS